jgi:hypothetical protein
MVQRIQTAWLLISAFLGGLLIRGGIVNFLDNAGNKLYTGYFGIYKEVGNSFEIIRTSIPLAAVIFLITILSLVTIFLYKSRKVQRVISLVLICFSLCEVILISFYSWIIARDYGGHLIPGIKMSFPLLILVTLILAYRGITRDEKLVNSYDRLR